MDNGAMNVNTGMGEKKSNSKLSQVLLVVVLLLVLVGLVVWFGAGETKEEFAPGQEKVTAAEGHVVGSFPSALLLEDDVEVIESYAINYTEEGLEQPVVVYRSKLDRIDNYRLFNEYFINNGWSIQKDLDQNSNAEALSMYVTSADADVNIVFSGSEEGEVVVTIAYLKK